MKNLVRLLIVPWYLVGWVLHVYLGLINPEIYRPFGQTALIPGFTPFWNTVLMPRITMLALALAVFEITVGVLLISKGRWVKVGLGLSIAFNGFLVQLGLSYPASDGVSSFLINRAPNLLFIALQIPLFWSTFNRSLPEVVRNWLRRSAGG